MVKKILRRVAPLFKGSSSKGKSTPVRIMLFPHMLTYEKSSTGNLEDVLLHVI